MRFPTICLLALPALAVAQQQVPFLERLKSYADQAQAYLGSAASKAADAASNPARAASAKAAEIGTASLTFENWDTVLKHSGKVKPYNPPEAWMVYITSSNTSCFGRCERADRAWNESVLAFSADPSAPHLATIECDKEELLCGAWAAHFPSIWFFLVPQPLPDQSRPETPIVIYNLNSTTVEVGDITSIHTKREYLSATRYTGALHPFDGWVAKSGLTKPMAQSLFYISKIPSWAFMIGLSFFSRFIMNKRMPRPAPTSTPQQATAAQ